MKSTENVFINALALLPRPTGTQRELVHLIELIPGVTLWGMNPSIPFMNKNGASCNSIQTFYKKFIRFLSDFFPPFCQSFSVRQIEVRAQREASSKWRIHLPSLSIGREQRADVQRRQPQYRWHQVSLSSCPSPAWWDCSQWRRSSVKLRLFLWRSYLLIDGFMARANVAFLNNLCCNCCGQLLYNRNCYFYIDSTINSLKDIRPGLMKFLTRSLGGENNYC